MAAPSCPGSFWKMSLEWVFWITHLTLSLNENWKCVKRTQNKTKQSTPPGALPVELPKLLPLPNHSILQWSLMCCFQLNLEDLDVQSEELQSCNELLHAPKYQSELLSCQPAGQWPHKHNVRASQVIPLQLPPRLCMHTNPQNKINQRRGACWRTHTLYLKWVILAGYYSYSNAVCACSLSFYSGKYFVSNNL